MSDLKTLVRKLRAQVAMMKWAPKPLIAQADAYLAVADNYMLVPVEPTAAMLAPFVECHADELDLAYQAMILAAQKESGK